MYVGKSSYIAKTSDCTRPGQNIWVLPRYYSKNVYCCICFIYLCLCLACPKGRIIWKIISSYHKHKNNQIYIYKITNHIHTKILKGYPFLTPFMMFDVRKLWVSSFMLVIDTEQVYKYLWQNEIVKKVLHNYRFWHWLLLIRVNFNIWKYISN